MVSMPACETASRRRLSPAAANTTWIPRLVASIIIVESRANPFAISESDSVGIMQIHLPTWGRSPTEQGINLFKIEDNVDLGVRILSGYIAPVRRLGRR